jgi:hypothetical protein
MKPLNYFLAIAEETIKKETLIGKTSLLIISQFHLLAGI